jgi:hypothetical protein
MQTVCVVIIQSFPTSVTSHLSANIPVNTLFLSALTLLYCIWCMWKSHTKIVELGFILIFNFYVADEKI